MLKIMKYKVAAINYVIYDGKDRISFKTDSSFFSVCLSHVLVSRNGNNAGSNCHYSEHWLQAVSTTDSDC